MYKTLTAGLTALSLILIPAAPVQAQNNQAEVNRAVLGILAIGGIALAMKNHQDQQRQARQTRTTKQTPVRPVHNVQRHDHGQQRVQHSRRGFDPVPGRCFRRVELANGRTQGVFGARCLDRRYRDAHTLPRQCQVRMGGPNGSRRGYDAGCLRDYGYRSDRRWH